MAGRSPTARSLQLLSSEGWTAAVVEQWVPGVARRRDLFGFVDIIAIRDDQTLAVQTTDITNVSHRVRKIEESPLLSSVRAAGWQIVVHGWHSDGRVREVDLS